MARRIIVDGIKVEGAEAQRIVEEALRDADETGAPRRLLPLSLLVVVAIATGVATGVTGYMLTRFAKGLPKGWYIAICIGVGIGVSVVCSRLHWRSQRRQLRAAMRRHGFDLCTRCGYWLKGLGEEQTRCPECGAPRG